MDIENYESIHEKIHIDLRLDKTKDVQMTEKVFESDMKYFE